MCKIRLHRLLFLLILLLVLDAKGEIKGICGDSLKFTLSDTGVLTIIGEGSMYNYSLRSLPWRPVMVNELRLPDGLVNICDNAFKGSNITVAQIPPTVSVIGKSAFANCKKLHFVTLHSGLRVIGDRAFSGCKSLSDLKLPSTVTSIGKLSFSDCSDLTSIGIPAKVEFIGENAFKGCDQIIRVTSLPDFITENNCSKYGLSFHAINIMNTDQIATMAVSDYSLEKPDRSRMAITLEAGVKYGESDIDINIPVSNVISDRTFAFIIANEEYSVMPNVPFALNDGRSFAAYCHATLGIPQSNINIYYNATYGNIMAAVDYIKQVDAIFNGDVNFIVYYAGHGAPDEQTSNAYIIPTDAYAVNETVCYPLDTFYKELGTLMAKSVKVFMDACFSGVGRTNDMLAYGGRLVTIAPKKGPVSGNVVVVSATSSDQTAWHYAPQGHGLFTYCLIKKMQETNGDVTMGDLCDYLQKEVPMVSIVQNRTNQTPTTQASPILGSSWRSWKLK